MYPDIKGLKQIVGDSVGKSFVVCDEINGDMETPIGIFQKLCRREKGYLLESNDGVGKVSRYSFIGYDIENFSVDNSVKDPLEEVKKQLQKVSPLNRIDNMPFYGGYVGYVGYDVIRAYEKIQEKNADCLKLPVIHLVCARKLICYDHVSLKIKIIVKKDIAGDIETEYQKAVEEINEIKNILLSTVPEYESYEEDFENVKCTIKSNTTKKKYIENVEKAKEDIKAGDIFQVVPSQRLSIEYDKDPFNVYRKLRVVNPSPYMYYMNFEDIQIVGSSPETLVKVIDGEACTMPIAGTRPRGENKDEDERLETELLSDKKELAEHLMLVDLGRNDIGKVCEFGSVHVNNLMHIEKFSHVMHIVTEVRGKMKQGKDAFDALKSCLPAGTVSGAPKVRAMQIIEELENCRRGVYAGAIGYFGYDGNMDTCIAIRTVVFKNGMAYLQAGGGVVYDSVGETEYMETLNKLRALTTTLGLKMGDEIYDFNDR